MNTTPATILCLVPFFLAAAAEHARAQATRSTCALTQADGTYRAEGPDYHARFLAGGLEFVPVAGGDASRPHTFHVALDRVERGGMPIVADGSTAAIPTGDLEIAYRHAPGVIERYTIEPDGIEQTFTLDWLPAGSGDLVVRQSVTTELRGPDETAPDGSLCFSGGMPGVRYGAASAMDAVGRALHVDTRWTGSGIELRVAAAELEGVTLPLTIDPLIGLNITLTSAGTDFDPRIAYHSSGRYLIIWYRNGVGLVGQLVYGGEGPAASSVFVIEPTGPTTAVWSHGVATVHQSNRFVVAYGLSMAGAGYLAVRAVDAVTGVVSPPASSFPSTVAGLPYPDPVSVGGDSQSSSPPSAPFDQACVSWSSAGPFGGANTYFSLVQIPPSGSGLAPVTLGGWQILDTGSFFPGNPQVCPDCGSGGRWLIAHTRTAGYFGAVVSRQGVLLTNGVNLGPLDGAYSCAGDGTNFVLAHCRFESPAATSRDVYARAGTWTGGTLSLQPDVPVAAVWGIDEGPPVVRLVHTKALVTWPETTNTTAGMTQRLAVRGLDPANASPIDARIQYYAASVTPGALPVAAMASRREGGAGPSDEALAVWATQAGNLCAQRVSGSAGAFVLSGGCGNGGSSVVGSTTIGNTIWLSISGAQGVFALLNWNTLSPPIALGSCLITPLGILNALPLTNGSATMQIAIPADPALVGASFEAQWIVAGSPSSPIPGFPNYSTSARWQITIGQ